MASFGLFDAQTAPPMEANSVNAQALDSAIYLAGQPAIETASTGSSGFPAWKRALDIISIVLTAPLWMTLMICLALWIRVASSGPVFYCQERVGYKGRRFMLLKFRSMKANADTRHHENHFDQLVESDIPMTKLDSAGDSRLIPGGWLIRATGLDELPQLFNILRGEMSLVGPRPCTPRELNKYQQWHYERFDATPGLTGYWQVNGKNKTTFSRMIELDIAYARKMSLRMDLEIVLRTIPAIVAQVREK